MNDKVEEYLKILYPEYDTLDENEKSIFDRKKEFIKENIEAIDNKFNEATEVENVDNINKIEEKNNAEKVVKDEEVNNDNIEVIEDSENIENVEEPKTEKSEDIELINRNKEILNDIIRDLKIEQYFELLHPEYETLTEEEKYDAFNDKIVIRENIEAIDTYFCDCKAPGSGAQDFGWSEQRILKVALQMFDQKKEKIFTPNDIELLTNIVRIENLENATKEIKKTTNNEENTEI